MNDKEMFKVYLFKKTGLSVGNAPDSLDNLIAKGGNNIIRVDDIYRLQPYVIDSLQVKGKFFDLQSVDYIILDNPNYEKIGYFVTSLNMINVNNARFTLLFDAVGTIGLGYNNKYSLVGGWCKRRHYTKKEDTLFNNILPEEFAPTLPSVIKLFEIGYSEGRTNLIASTINLTDNNGRINLDIDKLDTSNGIILKPIVRGGTKPTVVTLPENKTTGGLSQKIQSLSIYDGDLLGQDTLNKLNAYGLIDVITASYQVPSDLLEVSSKTGPFFNSISGSGKGVTSNLDFIYTNAKNTKVFAIGSNYTLMSVISGDSESFRPWEIETKGYSQPRFNLMADLTPGGKPYCRPEVYRGYKGEKMTAYFKCVEGSNWSNVPIITDGKNGYVYNQKLENLQNNIMAKEVSTLGAKLMADKTSVELSNSYALNSLLGAKESGENETYFYPYKAELSRLQDFSNKKGLVENIQGGASSVLANLGLTSGKSSTQIQQDRFTYENMLNTRKTLKDQILNENNLRRINATTNFLASNTDAQMNYLNTAYANTVDILRLKRQQELTAFNSLNMITPPNYTFATSNNLQNFLGNGFLVVQEMLHPLDVERLDNYLTQFGYSSNEKIKLDYFKNRSLYNYIQCSNIKVKATTGNLPQYLLDILEIQLMVGVRIWHVLPNSVTEEQFNTN